jgi:hypothetical protein
MSISSKHESEYIPSISCVKNQGKKSLIVLSRKAGAEGPPTQVGEVRESGL